MSRSRKPPSGLRAKTDPGFPHQTRFVLHWRRALLAAARKGCEASGRGYLLLAGDEARDLSRCRPRYVSVSEQVERDAAGIVWQKALRQMLADYDPASEAVIVFRMGSAVVPMRLR